MSQLPTIRWGILTTGKIASWYVADLVLSRPDAKVHHVVQAIGTSNVDRGKAFAQQHCPNEVPAIYGSYEEVYADPAVDIVYIGTPHAFHKRNCLDAIAAGKHVLCEKPFTLNAREARQTFEAARQKGVFIAEAMWLRHRPLVLELQRILHVDRAIGEIYRATSDFASYIDIPNLPLDKYYRQNAMGAGSLLDIGIYSLTWVMLSLDPSLAADRERPKILAAQTHWEDIELTTSTILQYPSTGRQGIVTSTTMANGNPDLLARIHGTAGSVEVHGSCPSQPEAFTVYPPFGGESGANVTRGEGKRYDYSGPGRGFQYQADNIALDVLSGRLESSIAPQAETIRVMETMDEIRRQGGTRYPVD
ncbi:Gfo/Idh/MocA family protein [Aspergillus undulatus]|uniref:Gfo/Idh/MocA family protein n=1 Tax=Aspergillus undulatus TaxID=1810928 RepID=UPI003CCCCD9C